MVTGEESPKVPSPYLVEDAKVEIVRRIIRQAGCCQKYQQQHLNEEPEVDRECQRYGDVAQGPLREPKAHAFENDKRSRQEDATIPPDRPCSDGKLVKAEGDVCERQPHEDRQQSQGVIKPVHQAPPLREAYSMDLQEQSSRPVSTRCGDRRPNNPCSPAPPRSTGRWSRRWTAA